MNKVLVAVFDHEDAAFEGLSALKDLHRNGDITLYSAAVIAKEKSGKIEIKQAAEAGPVGGAVGLLAGSLIGLFGGPVGVAVGASVGGLAGLIFDVSRVGIDAAFLEEVGKSLTVRNWAVLAEVDETWTTPVDSRLDKFGAIVFRRLRGEVVADQLLRESEALQADLKTLRDDLRHAAEENRASIQRDIERQTKQIKAIQSQVAAKLEQFTLESEARVAALRDQATAASGRAKARIESRIAEAQADLAGRAEKLNRAWALTKEALAA